MWGVVEGVVGYVCGQTHNIDNYTHNKSNNTASTHLGKAAFWSSALLPHEGRRPEFFPLSAVPASSFT